MADKKYPGYNADDTHFDDLHRSQGLMTNREFFTSNAKGGFYEGMEWDEDEQKWVPDAASRQYEWEQEQKRKENECPDGCGFPANECRCY